MRLPVDRRPVAYAIALAALLVALALRAALTPWLGTSAPYVTVYGAIALAVWFGGIGPALLVALGGFWAASVLFLQSGGYIERLLG